MYYVVFACPSRCFRWLSWDSFKCGISGCPTGWLTGKRKRTDECPSPRDGPRATDYHFGGRTAKRHSFFYLKSINDKSNEEIRDLLSIFSSYTGL
ncbi:hypothetical protein BCR43DRAFT_482388 [Syncephalastrum racemosum]|uniref:Uncharacterized protein n=1 Tax=Syncephalastrum racemosum TaxID=13706 RepID=A0A1X2HTJ1_SYNRA|nr:hypothetical protein BCR43DRAFT_482388 [Syncephalastrum racemosum]